MSRAMSNRERILAVFEHRETDRIVWQPRLHHWYYVNKARGTLPRRYEGAGILEVYDDLDASPRGYHYFNDTVRCVEGDKVQLRVKEEADRVISKYITPKGSLTQVERKTEHGVASLRVDYFLKNVADIKLLEYILKRQTFEFDENLYQERMDLLGNRTEPVITVPWGSIQRFFIVYMGFQRGVVALWRHREDVERLLQAFSENDDRRFDLVRKTPFRVVNFGDNIDEGLCSPPLFQRYMLPYYQLRTKELHNVGKFCTSHWDGRIRQLLPLVQETGLDGLECVPPKPQGNVTLEELKEGLEDMILVDGIPATHFLDTVSDEELEAFVYRILDLFKPRIVLGISDMLPPDGSIEKVRMVGEILANYHV